MKEKTNESLEAVTHANLLKNKKEENTNGDVSKCEFFEEKVTIWKCTHLGNAAITLIALVITIVVLVILASVAINLSLGENGIFNKAKYAKEESKISQYKEKIEIVKAETRLKYTDGVTLEKLKNTFDENSKKQWVNNTEIITDNSIEKIKLTTNDGYIFYITNDTTEYKGKDGVIIEDTSINAKMISYSRTWNDTTITDVEQALDYLYTQFGN